MHGCHTMSKSLKIRQIASRLSALVFLLATGMSASAQTAAVTAHVSTALQERPNILLIVLDDLGFNDLGVYGNTEITTPNIDHFASQGVRFTRNYVDSTCTATRAGIMTGQEPRVNGFAPNALGISPEVETLAESLQAVGYSTHHIGKWHLGYESQLSWPTEQGFDTFFGFLAQQLLQGKVRGKFLTQLPTYRDPWLQHNIEEPTQHPGHLTQILANYSEEFLTQKKGQKKPWFVTVWTYAPHAPVDPLELYAAKYPPTPAGKYRALVEQMDAAVGKMLAGLEASGEADNTLVMIVSDNGGTEIEIASNAPFYGSKATFLEGGVRTPLIIRWPGKLQPNTTSDHLVSYLDYFPTLATAALAPIPAGLSGRNIADIIHKESELPKSLHWETSNSDAHMWSVLSKDGRWRLGSHYYIPIYLNDLEADPTGKENVLEQYPEIGEGLREDYLSWSKVARQVKYDYVSLSDTGQAKLTGHSLLRAPGNGGYTFAIALKPAGRLAEARKLMLGDEKQVIAFQKNQWQLYQKGSRLHLQLNGLQLDVGLPRPQKCSSVVLTSAHIPGHLNPNRRAAKVELYINGKQVAQVRQKGYPPLTDDYLQPTYIGQDDKGESRYKGKLDKPLLLSERLVAREMTDHGIDNDLNSVESLLCAAAE